MTKSKSEINKSYYLKHKDIINKNTNNRYENDLKAIKMTCICGRIIIAHNIKNHLKTKIHLKLCQVID